MNIKKTDGTSETLEVIASFELSDSGKIYVTYTKGDVDVNGNVITYTNTVVDGNLMPVETDPEWAKIKETLLKMTKGPNEDVKKMLKPVAAELVETKTTNAEARHALSISKDFKNAIKAQYDTDMTGANASAEPVIDAGQDIAVPSFNPEGTAPIEAPVAPVEVPVAPVEEPVAPVEMPVAPVEEPVTPVEMPVAPVEPVVEVPTEPTPMEIPEVAPVEITPVAPIEEPAVEEPEPVKVDVSADIDRIIAELEELKAKLA